MYLFLCSDSTEAAAPKSVDDLCRSRHNSREISELPTEAGSVHQRFGYGFCAVARVNVLSLYIAQPSFVWRATRPTQGLQAIFNQWMKVVKYRFSSRPTRNHHRPMTFFRLFSFCSTTSISLLSFLLLPLRILKQKVKYHACFKCFAICWFAFHFGIFC